MNKMNKMKKMIGILRKVIMKFNIINKIIKYKKFNIPVLI